MVFKRWIPRNKKRGDQLPYTVGGLVDSSVAGIHRPLDLAAMTLTPSDLYTVDLFGFGFGSSSMRDFETEVEVCAWHMGQIERDTFAEALRHAGFQRRAVSNLLRPIIPLTFGQGGDAILDSSVMTSVAEFDSELGAEQGFKLLSDESARHTTSRDSDFPTLGDQSNLTTFKRQPTQPSGSQCVGLCLSIRRKNIVARVIMSSFVDEEFERDSMLRLGETFLERIDRELSTRGPNLSNSVLRFSPIGGQILKHLTIDRYFVNHNDSPPSFIEIVDTLRYATSWHDAGSRRLQASSAEASVGHRVTEYQVLIYERDPMSGFGGVGRPIDFTPFFAVALYQEETVDGAMDTFWKMRENYAAVEEVGLLRFAKRFPQVGDQSFTGWIRERGQIIYGTVSRVGSRVFNMTVRNQENHETAKMVEEIVAAQIGCLGAVDEICSPPAVPPNWLPNGFPSPSASSGT